MTSVNSVKANGSYKVGDVIDVIVNFSETVTSTGNGSTYVVVDESGGTRDSALIVVSQKVSTVSSRF